MRLGTVPSVFPFLPKMASYEEEWRKTEDLFNSRRVVANEHNDQLQQLR